MLVTKAINTVFRRHLIIKYSMPPKTKKSDLPPPKPVPYLPTSFADFQDALGSWKKPLEKYINGKTFQNIHKYVQNQYQTKVVYPAKQNIFNAFKLTPISNIKVVIIGQDPYFNPDQAHGLCFSVLKPVPPPPSLKNIYKNLENDPKLTFKAPKHGDLTKWAKQGVFLLNATLTVEYDKANSHSKCGWQDFTDEVIKLINNQCKGVVFLLWGGNAKSKAKSVDPKKHYILETSHPSPMSVTNGFSTCRHFSECNQLLEKEGKTPVDWNLDP